MIDVRDIEHAVLLRELWLGAPPAVPRAGFTLGEAAEELRVCTWTDGSLSFGNVYSKWLGGVEIRDGKILNPWVYDEVAGKGACEIAVRHARYPWGKVTTVGVWLVMPGGKAEQRPDLMGHPAIRVACAVAFDLDDAPTRVPTLEMTCRPLRVGWVEWLVFAEDNEWEDILIASVWLGRLIALLEIVCGRQWWWWRPYQPSREDASRCRCGASARDPHCYCGC